MEEEKIRVEGLTRYYGKFLALDGVSFSVPAGQVCGYLGPNGAGKTTTIKILTGLIRPTKGRAWIAGFDLIQTPLEAKKRIGFVPESGALYEKLTPSEYLQMVGELRKMEPDLLSSRVEKFLQLFGLSKHKDQRMDTFSKGMKQKVLLSGAMLHDPDVLFLDEPLNGLDANTALLVKELIRNMAARGKTIFYSSHIMEVVEKVCDRIIILDKGRIAADGSIEELRAMTRESSLEDVFSQVTHSEDMAEIARAFTRDMGT